jgi:Protein of unknown function (DUF4239)
MLHWIESQSTSVIAGLMFAFCYAMAAAALLGGVLLSRRTLGEELKTLSAVTLTPLAVILGLLIAFIAARVWDNVAQADEYVGQEATALSEVILLSNTLPPEIRTRLREAVRAYIAFIEEKDWPAMATFSADLRSEPVGLKAALTLLLSFRAAEPSQEFARQQVLGAIERAFVARENRIRLSKAQIAPIQWTAIVVLASLILATTAMIHIGRPAAMTITLLIFSTAVAMCLILLMAYDRPFAAGGVYIPPAAFREISFD